MSDEQLNWRRCTNFCRRWLCCRLCSASRCVPAPFGESRAPPSTRTTENTRTHKHAEARKDKPISSLSPSCFPPAAPTNIEHNNIPAKFLLHKYQPFLAAGISHTQFQYIIFNIARARNTYNANENYINNNNHRKGKSQLTTTMRIKQTARKSTTGPSGTQNSSQQDPVRSQMRNLLQTKRKSATPSLPGIKPESQASTSSYSSAGIGKGKAAYSRGKQIGDPRDRVKQRPRSKSGVIALREIKRLQKGFNLLIPRASFHRLVREITLAVATERNDSAGDAPGLKYQAAALEALQEATETFMIGLFEDAYLCTLHAKRVTLFIQDMRLCQRLQKIPYAPCQQTPTV